MTVALFTHRSSIGTTLLDVPSYNRCVQHTCVVMCRAVALLFLPMLSLMPSHNSLTPHTSHLSVKCTGALLTHRSSPRTHMSALPAKMHRQKWTPHTKWRQKSWPWKVSNHLEASVERLSVPCCWGTRTTLSTCCEQPSAPAANNPQHLLRTTLSTCCAASFYSFASSNVSFICR
jgi:hypothetical protein